MKNNAIALMSFISKRNKGDIVYINSINLTSGAIDALRTMIKSCILKPDEDEVKLVYSDVESVMNGDVIFPQMHYIKL